MVKPDGVKRNLTGEIIKRFERKNYKLVAIKLVCPTEELLRNHYNDLKEKEFFPKLVGYILSGPVVAMVWEGINIVENSRTLLGSTNPQLALPGTIRADYCVHISRNIAHASDSVKSASREIKLWFDEKELMNWVHPLDNIINEQ